MRFYGTLGGTRAYGFIDNGGIIMNELPFWPPIVILLIAAVIYGIARYDHAKFQKKYGKDED